MNIPTAYTLLSCRFDSESGDRPWNFLFQEQIKAIDIDIARTAFRANNSAEETARVIFFGSPNAQAIVDYKQRCNYVASMLMANALSPKPLTF